MLHIITGLNTGGAERALYNLLQGGLATEFDSCVISLGDEGTISAKIKALNVPVITLNMKSGWLSIAGILKLRKTIKTIQPDLIQGWMYHGNLAATLAKFFSHKKTKLIWNIRCTLYDIKDHKRMSRIVIRLNRFLSKLPDMLLYNSQVSCKLHTDFGFSKHRAKVIPNGINTEQFCPSIDSKKSVRLRLGIPENALVVGHIARFHPMKDHTNFLQAAQIIANNNSNIHFILIGKDVLKSNNALNQHILSSSENRFHLLGEQQEVASLMSAMDVFSNSSWTEAFPNVLGEAMSSGVPCVATDVGDSAFIIGDCGVVVNPKDKNALASGIESLINMPDATRYALGQKARKRIEDNFTLGIIVDKYINLYHQLEEA